MICTARELLKREEVELSETVYAAMGDGYLDYPMSMGSFFERKRSGTCQWALRYKHHLQMDTLENIRGMLPELKTGALDWLNDRPLFTEHIAELAAADRGEVAVEGGPCLFGTDEVYTILQLFGGERVCFDGGSGAHRPTEDGLSLAEFLRERGNEVAEVSFCNLKAGYSSQELELSKMIFAVAAALQCPLVFSLPDMSYRKYFNGLLGALRPGVRERAIAAYGEVVHHITDLYFQLLHRLQKRFPVPELVVLHERNHADYKIFLQGRERFCTIDDVTTNRPEMRASIHDYMTLPAAPYHLLGAKHILEINSTDETDPLRKCAKLHKKQVKFHQMMLPEPVSADGSATVFTAMRDYKGYVLLEELAEADDETHAAW